MDALTQKKEQRYLFLKHLYDVAEGDENEFFSVIKLGKEIGLDESTTQKVAQYLTGENLIRVTSHDIVQLTHYGVIQIEEATQQPNQSTAYFPPITNMNIILNGTTIHGGLNVASVIQDSY